MSKIEIDLDTLVKQGSCVVKLGDKEYGIKLAYVKESFSPTQPLAKALEAIAAGTNQYKIPPVFTFLREGTYSCGKITHTVKEYRHEPTSTECVLIPGGTYMMGSLPEEKGRYSNEKQHQVTLAPFLMAKYLCTQSVWEKMMKSNRSHFRGAYMPVESVSWYECQEFCIKAGVQLPTEAQWELACRADNTGAYCFGDDESLLKEYAWYYENANNETHAVGQKSPNAYGLYDMHGNVWEWCRDCCDCREEVGTDTYMDGITNPLCEQGSSRIIRGGSWFRLACYCRSAYRDASSPGGHYHSVGFRFIVPLVC